MREVCCFHTFSAFWLRSSVVSVLISLISDTCSYVEHQLINLIFEAGWGEQELALALSHVASVLHSRRALRAPERVHH